MFLDITDYKSVCDEFELEQVSALTDDRLVAERAAMELVCSYTRSRYDMDAEFALEGNERNPMIVQCMVNIALYHLIHRLPQSMGHDRRQCLYDDAIKWLEAVRDSEVSPDLPTYTADDGTTDANNPVRFGSFPPSRTMW